MKKPAKRRPADPNMRMHSVLADVIGLSNQPIVAPSKRTQRTKPKRK